MKPARESWVAAAVFGAVGLGVGSLIVQAGSRVRVEEGWSALPLYAAAAAFLLGLVSWQGFVAGSPGATRGLAAGLVTGVAGHPLTWYLYLCANWALLLLNLRPPPSAGATPMNPLTGLAGAAIYSVFTLFALGPITVTAGALVGTLLGTWQGRRARAKAAAGRTETLSQ